ncbi:efflux transporter outer membrane subunit [Massilia sp. DWR3-1-1]|uniref:efflux transporter outer membrane subunit n=1 Tax=Massilia sp. DWR3-1-1 TaxID=2804559 RepID=UPI003CF6C8E5
MYPDFPRKAALAAAIALLAAGLSGCATKVALPEATPAVDVPLAWTNSAKRGMADRIDADWWKRFGNAELTGLVAAGQVGNLDLGAARARVRQAEAQARIAGVQLLPTVDLASGASRDVPLGSGAGSTSANVWLSTAYEVDFWGKNDASVKSADASLKANRYDRQTVALTTTSAIVSVYLQVLSLNDRLDIAREHVDNAEKVLVLVQAQLEAGSASTLDLARQRSAVAGLKAAIPDLQQQAREALSALAILLGRQPQTFDIDNHGLDSVVLPDVTPGLPSELLSRRPDILRAEAVLDAANADVFAARAALFPRIRLTSAAGAQSNALLALFNGPNLLATVGASLITPIFDGGRLKSERDLAIARKQELVQVYRATVVAALSEVDNVLGLIRTIDEQRRLKSMELEQARIANDLSQIRYKVGAEDLMTVLDTQRTMSDVQNELGLLKLKRLHATVSLFKALGGGWRDEGKETPADKDPGERREQAQQRQRAADGKG